MTDPAPTTDTEPPPATPAVRLRGGAAHRTVERILAAARTTFARDGYQGAHMNEIAEAAGVSRATLYNYFVSKDALLRELVTRVIPDMLGEVPPVGPSADEATLERIDASNRHYLAAYRRHLDLMVIWDEASRHTPELTQLMREARRPFLTRVEHSIRHLQDAGLAAADLDARTTAYALTGMVSRFAYVWLIEGEDFDEETALATLRTVWARALGIPLDDGGPATRSGAGPAPGGGP